MYRYIFVFLQQNKESINLNFSFAVQKCCISFVELVYTQTDLELGKMMYSHTGLQIIFNVFIDIQAYIKAIVLMLMYVSSLLYLPRYAFCIVGFISR